MGEEMKRIEAAKQASKLRAASRSTNLTGEQLFIRTCNTCHPGGKEGMGPRLDKLSVNFITDDSLKAFIRHGRGMMPAQPPEVLNEEEMNNLIAYLRELSVQLNEDEANKH
jgi:mono/diheme cytochrome c family protein